MLPPMITGWPTSLYRSGMPSMSGPKARVAPFRWTRSVFVFTIDGMAFELGRVMGNVIDHVHPEVFGRATEYIGEDLPDPVDNDLAVGKGHIDRAFHGGEIISSLGGIERAPKPARGPES